jgi:hypothetical protein
LREAAVRLGLQEWFGEHVHFNQLPDAVAAFSKQATDRGDAAAIPKSALPDSP